MGGIVCDSMSGLYAEGRLQCMVHPSGVRIKYPNYLQRPEFAELP